MDNFHPLEWANKVSAAKRRPNFIFVGLESVAIQVNGSGWLLRERESWHKRRRLSSHCLGADWSARSAVEPGWRQIDNRRTRRSAGELITMRQPASSLAPNSQARRDPVGSRRNKFAPLAEPVCLPISLSLSLSSALTMNQLRRASKRARLSCQLLSTNQPPVPTFAQTCASKNGSTKLQ